MFNLNDILQNAQGGNAAANLARQFGISPQQAEAAMREIVPALSSGLTSKLGQTGGLGSLLGTLNDDQHKASFSSPNAAQSEAAADKGHEAVGQIFGSENVTAQITEHVARATGLSPDLIARMLPVVASMAMGGVMAALQKQGWGGVFGQLATIAQQGGLGSILGQFGGGAPPAGGPGTTAPPPTGGGIGGVVSSVLGGLFGGHANAPAGGPPGAAPTGGGLDATTVQAGIDALSKMFQPGALPPGQGHLPDLFSQILAQARR